jgi:hypothetical protein
MELEMNNGMYVSYRMVAGVAVMFAAAGDARAWKDSTTYW